MASKTRDFQAAEVMADALLDAGSEPGKCLIMGEPTGLVAQEIKGPCQTWARRAGSLVPAQAQPPEGPFDTILVRMTRSAEELRYVMALGAARLAPGGVLYLFGANDEGIRSQASAFEPWFDVPDTVMTKRHCRVFHAALKEVPDQSDIEGFAQTVQAFVGDVALNWTSWPGMFAHGRLDAGSAFLIENLPDLAPGARVLDYGCGAGVLSLALQGQTPDLDITLLDNDALALEVAAQNVAGAETLCGTDLSVLSNKTFDLIISNPPVHIGMTQTFQIVEALITKAPDYLPRGGQLYIVVQGTTPVRHFLEAKFKNVHIIASNKSFTIYSGLL